LLLAGCFLGLLFKPEFRGNIFLRNICELLPNLTVSHPKQQNPTEDVSAENSFKSTSLLAFFPYFEKIEVGL
jgi:hypothetical protein